MYARRVVIAAVIASFVFLSGMGAVYAQSTDTSEPGPLTANRSECEIEPGGENHCYSFIGDPGVATLTVSGAIDYGSSSINVIVPDAHSTAHGDGAA
jgi:hypothetical protein